MKYFIFISLLILTPVITYAQVKTFQTLPGLENAGSLTTQQYIDALYTIAITVAAILAVFKLMWAGVQYMLSDVVTNKQKAKDDIKGALLGLLIILVAVTLLNAINPNLTNLDFLRNADPTEPVQGGVGRRAPDWEVAPGSPCPEGQANICGISDGRQACRCLPVI